MCKCACARSQQHVVGSRYKVYTHLSQSSGGACLFSQTVLVKCGSSLAASRALSRLITRSAAALQRDCQVRLSGETVR